MAAPLLIVWHSRTGASEQLAQAAKAGAANLASLVPAAKASPAHFLAAAGFLFVCPENLGSMSGLMKEMFDRCYYPLLGQLEGRAYATVTAAGSDGSNAVRQIDRIVTGWRLRRVAEPVIVNLDAQTASAILAPKRVESAMLDEVSRLGQALGEGLTSGIF